MDTQQVAALCCLAAALVAGFTNRRTTYRIMFLVLVVSLGLLPSSDTRSSVSIGPTHVSILAFGIPLLLTRQGRAAARWYLPAVTLAFAYAAFQWPGGITSAANIAFLCLAWTIGSALGEQNRRDPKFITYVGVVILLLLLFETIIAAMQAGGSDIFPMTGRTLELEGARANGTYNHPGVLGKVIAILLPFTLPLSSSNHRLKSLLGYGVILTSILGVSLTASRANTIAILAIVLSWIVLQPASKNIGRKLALLLSMGLVLSQFIDSIMARFSEDPDGGPREQLITVTLEHLPKYIWTGAGPGQFVEEFGKYDQLVANDWPVHNVLLLLAAEVGLPVLALMSVPVVALVARSLRSLKAGNESAEFARAFLSFLPGFLAIAMTSWGLLLPHTLFLLGIMGGWTLAHLPTESCASESLHQSHREQMNLTTETRKEGVEDS